MNSRERGESSFTRDILRCLISPRSSFRSIVKKPSLVKATALIFMIALVAAWASFNYAEKLPLDYLLEQRAGQTFPGQGSPIAPEQLRQAWTIMSAAMASIGVFTIWFISSALVHGLSKPLGGKGSFRSMLTLTGYASAPLLIQQLLRLIYSFMITKEEAIQLATSLQISASPLINRSADAAVEIFTIFRIWSIVLLVIASRENYKMSTNRSAVAVILSFVAVVFVSVFLPLR